MHLTIHWITFQVRTGILFVDHDLSLPKALLISFFGALYETLFIYYESTFRPH